MNSINWQEEIQDAIKKSIKLAELEQGELNLTAKENLFKYAAIFAAKNRNISSPDTRKDMIRFAAQRRNADFKAVKNAKENYELNFMLAYLDSHIFIQRLNEKERDCVMKTLIDNYSRKIEK